MSPKVRVISDRSLFPVSLPVLPACSHALRIESRQGPPVGEGIGQGQAVACYSFIYKYANRKRKIMFIMCMIGNDWRRKPAGSG